MESGSATQEVKLGSGAFNVPTLVVGGSPAQVHGFVLRSGLEVTIRSIDVYRVK